MLPLVTPSDSHPSPPYPPHRPAAFPFFYIEPSKKSYLPIVQKFTGPITRKEAEQIAPIGNAPTLMSLDDLTRVFPVWFNLSIAIHNDEQAAKVGGGGGHASVGERSPGSPAGRDR